MKSRVGIYAGTFDPVHAGHTAFALQSMARAKLDGVYFLPERRPQTKKGVEHFGHRVAMLRQAVRPYPAFDVLELDDISFSVARTLPRLYSRLPDAQLIFLLGSDTALNLPAWFQSDRLLEQAELVVGCRMDHEPAKLEESISGWAIKPRAHTIFKSYAAGVSSSQIREALKNRQSAQGVLRSVEKYSDRNWLYVSLA